MQFLTCHNHNNTFEKFEREQRVNWSSNDFEGFEWLFYYLEHQTLILHECYTLIFHLVCVHNLIPSFTNQISICAHTHTHTHISSRLNQ
jgi:hypothetical protein